MSEKKTSGLTKSLISFIFILLPGLILGFFFSKDGTKNPVISYSYTGLIACFFILFSIMISGLFIKFKIAGYDLLNFTLPIAVLMMIILITYPLSNGIRAIIVIASIILVTLPTNMVVARISENKLHKYKKEEDEDE